MTRQVEKDRLAVFDEAKESAHSVERQVRGLASVIADIMAEFHGEPMRVCIDHEIGLVLVRPI